MDTYVKISSFFLISLIVVILYFYFLPILPSWFLIPSFCSGLQEPYCPSAGLTRGIHFALQGDFEEALSYNQDALHVSAFFVSQLIMRFAVIIFHAKLTQKVLVYDVITSIVMFLFVFFRFLIFIK